MVSDDGTPLSDDHPRWPNFATLIYAVKLSCFNQIWIYLDPPYVKHQKIEQGDPPMGEAARAMTKAKGAEKAGGGRYHFAMEELSIVPAGTGYSTSEGVVVEGDRMLLGYIHKPRGTGSRPHSHPNEQFNYVLQGTLQVEIDGQSFSAPAGTLVYVPANVEHSMVATPERRFTRGERCGAGCPSSPHPP